MRSLLARRWPWLVLFSILTLSFGAAWSISLAVELPSRDDFNVVRWELRHIPDKWLYLTGRAFRGQLTRAEEDERLGRFLELSLRIDALERNGTPPDADPELQRLARERDELEQDAGAIIEGRVTRVLEQAGLESTLPLFPNARWVFPPVDVEFDRPPNEIAISPRDRILLIDERPLTAGLSREEVEAIEQREERDGTRSALVQPLDGVATYPSIVAPDGDYRALVELTAHEWVHHYLFFKPLGSRFYESLELRTLNETVATVAGQQIASAVVRDYPLPADIESRLAALQPVPAPAAAGDILRSLRRDVDVLLARGQIAEAEALMERRRQQLAARGIFFRRINQAFFAFANVYATSPASTDPIGEKVLALRDRTQTVGPFLRAAADLTSEADLDRLLSKVTSSGGTGR